MKADWRTAPIGEVCEVVNGGTPKTGVITNWGGPHKWITPAEMGGRTSPYASNTERQLTDAGLDAANLLPPYSVILSSRAPIGHLVINTVPMAFNQGCKGLVPKKELDHKFLYYFLFSSVDLLNALGTGATFKELSGGKLKEVAIPVPPLDEQRRMVAMLDEAFEAIAAATVNARENLGNGASLLHEARESALSQRASGWIHTTIGDQLTLQRGFDITKSQQRLGTVPVVSSSGVKSFHDAAQAGGPGVVIGRKGSLGTVFYMDQDYWPHDTTLWVKEFNGNDPKFVYHFFKNLEVAHLDSGAANPALNRNAIHPIKVWWPPKSQQKPIVDRLERLTISVCELQDIYRKKMGKLRELRQSILERGFTGKLAMAPAALEAVE